MSLICVLFILFCIALMYTPVVCASSSVEDIVSSMRRFFNHDEEPITRCVAQAMDIRAREAHPLACHPFAQQLASSDEGPEYALSCLWDSPIADAYDRIKTVVDFTDGEVLSIERIK